MLASRTAASCPSATPHATYTPHSKTRQGAEWASPSTPFTSEARCSPHPWDCGRCLGSRKLRSVHPPSSRPAPWGRPSTWAHGLFGTWSSMAVLSFVLSYHGHRCPVWPSEWLSVIWAGVPLSGQHPAGPGGSGASPLGASGARTAVVGLRLHKRRGLAASTKRLRTEKSEASRVGVRLAGVRRTARTTPHSRPQLLLSHAAVSLLAQRQRCLRDAGGQSSGHGA